MHTAQKYLIALVVPNPVKSDVSQISLSEYKKRADSEPTARDVVTCEVLTARKSLRTRFAMCKLCLIAQNRLAPIFSSVPFAVQ